MKEKSTKDVAQRIDPVYYRRRHPLRRLRLLLSVGLVAAGAIWVAASFALSNERIYVRGGMSRAHAPLVDECGRCHAQAFGSVADASCLACHVAGPHVPAGKTPPDPRAAGATRTTAGASASPRSPTATATRATSTTAA